MKGDGVYFSILSTLPEPIIFIVGIKLTENVEIKDELYVVKNKNLIEVGYNKGTPKDKASLKLCKKAGLLWYMKNGN